MNSSLMQCSGTTHIGLKRKSNEDQFLIADICKSMRIHQTSVVFEQEMQLFGEAQGKILLIADGMGGHEAGERASQIVTASIVDYILNWLVWFSSDRCYREDDFKEELRNAILSCQQRIDREIAEVPQRRGMGSTLTMGYIVWPYMFLAHIGDSRCYLLRDGVLKLLTRDHTLGQLAMEKAIVASEGLRETINSANSNDEDDFPDGQKHLSNVLWNVLGGGDDNEPTPDVKAIELRKGDKVLLCSDGLSSMVARAQIKEILSLDIPTDSICSKFIDAANEAGGSDNISVVVGYFPDTHEQTVGSEEVVRPRGALLAHTVDEIEAS